MTPKFRSGCKVRDPLHVYVKMSAHFAEGLFTCANKIPYEWCAGETSYGNDNLMQHQVRDPAALHIRLSACKKVLTYSLCVRVCVAGSSGLV